MSRLRDAYESRPAGNGAATSIENTAVRSGADSTEPVRLSHRAALAEVERRAELTGYVVRAVTTMTNGAVKVQHYASLHAAVKAAGRAERRGCVCVLSLCRVVPVERLVLEDEAVAR